MEELYLIIDDKKIKLDIKSPSGIVLKYVSNMFNDLSKFGASYSYTFKLPKTRNNKNALDNVDDIRYDSTIYGKRIKCEFYRDGIRMFDNSYLYVNECSTSYNAVMTWNVLSWLLEVNESGKSIKDIEKDFEGANITTVDFEHQNPEIDAAQSMAGSSVSTLYRCGQSITYRSPRVIPVRYLLDKISRHFGRGNAIDTFSFIKENPLTNEDFKVANHSFNIADDGAIPLVNGKWSNNYLNTQVRRCEKLLTTRYDDNYPMIDILGKDISDKDKSDVYLFSDRLKQYVSFSNVTGVSEYVRFFKNTGTATKDATTYIKDKDGKDTEEIDYPKITWTKDGEPNGMYMAFASASEYRSLPLILRGRFKVTDYGRLHVVPFIRVTTATSVFVPNYDDAVVVDATEVEGTTLYEYNFDPEQGGQTVEVEHKDDAVFFALMLENYRETFIVDGYIKFLPKRENISAGYMSPDGLNVVDLFFNLPDIKIIDFLKSLFYIENSYPFIEKDGRIGQMRYEDLYRNIERGNVYDWSDILLGSTDNDTIKYTNGNLGRINRFNMKNYSTENKEEEESALKYDDPSSYFETENESLKTDNTIYTFPYASAALVTKNGFSAGGTFIFWELDQDNGIYKVAGTINPIIGRVRSCKEGRLYTTNNIYIREYLKFDIWQVANKEYDNTVLAAIFKKPYVITTKGYIDTFELSTLDFTKPVYLSRYNAYFGIISIQCDSKGVSKAELIKLPHFDLSTLGGVFDPEIEIVGSSVLYKKKGQGSMALYKINASVVGSRINRMVVSLDGKVVADADMEIFSFSEMFYEGTHLIEVTAYAENGRSKTEYFETRVDYAAEGAAIDFLTYSYALKISNTKPNIAKYKIGVYNNKSAGTLKLYKYRKGYPEKVLLGSTNETTLEVEFEYFEQLASNGTADVTWVLSAEFDNSTEHAITTKNVTVSVDRSMLKYYNGVISGAYFQMIVKGYNYREGSYIDEAFKYGDLNAQYMVIGAQVPAYYVEIHFLCYTSYGSTYEYIHRIDPYYGTSTNITLSKLQYNQYQRIKVTAIARFYAVSNTNFTSREIWIYRDKQ